MIDASVQAKNIAVVLRGLDTLDARVLQGAEKGMAAGLEDTIGHIRRNKLLGQVLNRRTGQLIKSIERDTRIVPGQGVVGRIGSNLPYAAGHELGWAGVQQVRAHTRVVGASFSRQGGASYTGKAAARRLRTGAVSFQQVKAHARKVNFKERSYVRSGIRDRTSTIMDWITRDIGRAMETPPNA